MDLFFNSRRKSTYSAVKKDCQIDKIHTETLYLKKKTGKKLTATIRRRIANIRHQLQTAF